MKTKELETGHRGEHESDCENTWEQLCCEEIDSIKSKINRILLSLDLIAMAKMDTAHAKYQLKALQKLNDRLAECFERKEKL